MKQSTKKTLTILIAAAVLAPILSYLIMAPEYREIYTYVRVANYTGFDVNTTAMTFGAITEGTATRGLIIKNTDGFDKKPSFTLVGNMSRYVRILDAEKPAKANDNTTYTVVAEVPPGAPLGYYDGQIKVFLRRAI